MATLRMTVANAANVITSSNGTTDALLTTSNIFSAPVTPNLIFGNPQTGISLLIIYKGTPETFPSFTDRATRASDVLVTFSLPASPYQLIGDTGTGFYRLLVGRHTSSQAATGTGTATWFLSVRSGTTTLADKGAMIGTVGVSGSGADLEIADVNIVTGNNYQCNGFYLNIPANWTV